MQQPTKSSTPTINSNQEKISTTNAKLSLLDLPYRVTEDYGIRLNKEDIKEITIYEPVDHIPKDILMANGSLKRVNIGASVKKYAKVHFHFVLN